VLHLGKTLRRRVAAGVHLIGQLLHQRLQLDKLGVAGCKEQEERSLVSKKPGWIKN
jgi:hypothetical protein